MSRLDNIVEKPFTKTIQWKNEKFDKKLKKVTQEKGWYYYQKSNVEGEKGVNIPLEEPIKGLWLMSATSFTGYNEAEKKSIYSNEALSENDLKRIFPKNTSETFDEYNKKLRSYLVLKAKMGQDVVAEGLYKDIKDTVTSKNVGGKYCQPNYFLLINPDGSTEIVRFLFSGGSIETWIPFCKFKKQLVDNAVLFKGSDERSKGSVDYEVPLFEFCEVDIKYQQQANKAAQQMDEYFKFILNSAEEKQELATVEAEEETKEEYADDVPF
jgi:hypothetical protein